ncbi:MAG: hypothetical protein QNM02_04050, partial [Acidimicrobiia bacterium]|nr:hypothetical protein [Acidimicrobiia bacterium]
DLGPTHRPTRVGSATLRAAATLGPWGAFLASRHANCPADTLEQVAASSDWRLRSGILDNPCAEDAFIARAADLEPMDETAMSTGVDQLRVLADRSASVAALAALVDHPRPAVRLALARHPSLAGPIVGRLAADGSPDIRRIAARHPRIDPADVELLVRAGSTPDLMRLADPDPHLPEAELDRLASGGRWARQLAVRHPATPTATLARLMCDEDGKLREWAAAHPAAPRDVIAEIRRAGGAADFQGIAEPDPEVPIDVLRRVAALGPWGAMIVSWHPNAPAELSGSR